MPVLPSAWATPRRHSPAVCELAMQSPATPANALDLQILEGEIMYALDLGAAPEHFARAAGLAAELRQGGA